VLIAVTRQAAVNRNKAASGITSAETPENSSVPSTAWRKNAGAQSAVAWLHHAARNFIAGHPPQPSPWGADKVSLGEIVLKY
jgi:hypothetical protein